MTKEEAIQRLVDLQDGSGQTYEAIRMAIESLSAEVIGVGRYENAMQTLREMPKYFNGIKAKQIKKIQSDTVEVVRCEKCKHYSVEGFTTLFGWCNAKEHPTDEDDFCKYGERREHEKGGAKET